MFTAYSAILFNAYFYHKDKKIKKQASLLALDEKMRNFVAPEKDVGLVVQLVRIHACHAWGRGFESRPDRFHPPKLFSEGG